MGGDGNHLHQLTIQLLQAAALLIALLRQEQVTAVGAVPGRASGMNIY